MYEFWQGKSKFEVEPYPLPGSLAEGFEIDESTSAMLAQEFMPMADLNRDGKRDFEDFHSFVRKIAEKYNLEHVQNVFKSVDKNKDG